MDSLKRKIQIQIDALLDRDLELLDPVERTIERWFQLLGDDDDFKHSKSKLIELKNILDDIDNTGSLC